MTSPQILWPRPAGRLDLRLPTPESLEQVLRWRNRPDVTNWLLRTTVDPEQFRERWLETVEDHHSVAPGHGRMLRR